MHITTTITTSRTTPTRTTAERSGSRGARRNRWLRFAAAGMVVAVLIAAACLVVVPAGEALVGDAPGRPSPRPDHARLARQAPASPGDDDDGGPPPADDVERLPGRGHARRSAGPRPRPTSHGRSRTIRTGVRLYLRSVRNDPDEAARQLRTFLASALEVTLSDFDLAALVNTDPGRLDYDRLESRLREQLAGQGHRRLRHRRAPGRAGAADPAGGDARRHRVAHERGARRSRRPNGPARDSGRQRRSAPAPIETPDKWGRRPARKPPRSRRRAGSRRLEIYANSYRANPKLYTMLRSLDTLENVVGENTRLILRTDAPPFRVFVEGPDADAGGGRPKATAASPRPAVER